VHGVVRKLVANAGRLALIRRALRWGTGEFGVFGPIGVVDEDDCDVACRAAEFFLTRYILWTDCGVSAAVTAGMSPAPGKLAQAEQILEYLATNGRAEADVRWIRQQTLRGNPSTAEIRDALDAAVAIGKGHWADPNKRKFIRT
jgi:nucleotide-binding universal stress UspA family protein